jgi:RNA polymerase sigma-70 factor (ECF subfamily)
MPPTPSRESSADELLRALVLRIRGGDVAAFEALFRAMHPGLVGFASNYVGDAARAEELVQDLFFDLWTDRVSWSLTGGARAYLYAAVRNRALNLRRRDAVERDWVDDESLDGVRALHARPAAPDAELETAEVSERIDRAISALPERCRIVMQLRWRDELSYAEIADVMGISLKGVENQLGRGLKALRKALGAT